MQSSSRERITQIALIAVFLIAIGAPLLGKLLPAQGAFALTENRQPAPFPTFRLWGPGWGWSVTSFPRRFERWWNDSFAFRWYLIRVHSIVKLGLGVSPSPKALNGLDGWLFYTGEQSLDYYRAIRPFTESELARWRDDLEARRRLLAGLGTRFLIVVAPNKETIYPEHMPPAFKPVREESRMDQLVAYLRSQSQVEVLDLRPALRAAKANGRLYHVTDTHWNDAGALVAYREILARLKDWFPDIDARPIPGELRQTRGAGGDLAKLLALEDRFPEERIEFVPSTAARAIDAKVAPAIQRDIIARECAQCGGPRVVMNHDSFYANLVPLLPEHFSRFVFVEGSRLEPALIASERPAVLIQEFVERALMCPDLRGC